MNGELNSKAIQLSPELVLFEHHYNDFSYPKHFHETYLIELVAEGTESFYCNGRNFSNVGRDSLVLINPGEVHTGGAGGRHHDAGLVCRVLYPELDAFQSVIGERADRNWPIAPLQFKETVTQDRDIALAIRKMYSLGDSEETLLLMYELYQEMMLGLMTRHMKSAVSFNESQHRYAAAIARGKEYINDNLPGKLSLEAIAKAAFLSPFHFLRVFKMCTGITLHQYVLSLRIEKAKGLLLKNNSIADTFNDVGFLSQAHFTKVFHRMTGVTPKQFKDIFKSGAGG